jgi:hypothetical protein
MLDFEGRTYSLTVETLRQPSPAQSSQTDGCLSHQIAQFAHLLSLLSAHFPIGIFGGQTLPLDVQSLLLNASPVLLNSTLLL